jgi:hypothetical protein
VTEAQKKSAKAAAYGSTSFEIGEKSIGTRTRRRRTGSKTAALRPRPLPDCEGSVSTGHDAYRIRRLGDKAEQLVGNMPATGSGLHDEIGGQFVGDKVDGGAGRSGMDGRRGGTF